MFEITDRIRLSEDEFTWRFVRSGGPGGQNVNKVASKAVLHWDLAQSAGLPQDVKARMRALFRKRFTSAGVLVLSSQRYRDQERNRQDCLDKLRTLVIEAATLPRVRKPSRPTRSSREARLQAKKHRSARKAGRKLHAHED
jgi:ribosome-associated protein